MKVVFLQDNGINESLAMTDISGLLKSRGHECDLFIQRNEKKFVRSVVESKPGLLIVPMDIWGERLALSIAASVKKELSVPIVFCGTYPMLFPEIINDPEVDIVVRGESEFPILDIVECLEKGEDYSDIPNLTIKRGGEIRTNEMRPLLQDLTLLPLPDRALYFKYPFMKQMSLKRFTSGRGCPNACSFCYNAKFREFFIGKGKYMRRKPVERIIAEIEDMKRLAPLRSIHFSDDIFTHDKKWVVEFCREYGKRFGDISFTCNTTVHDVDDEMLAEMKKANCSGIAIGVETGNERLRIDKLNKHYLDSQIIATAALIKKHGLYLTAFNMIALPYETIDNAFETVQLNRFIKADNVRVTFLSPIPRTAMVEDAVKDGLLEVNYEKTGMRIMTPEIHTKRDREFETLYALIDIAVLSPFWEKVVRKLLHVKIPKFMLFFLLLPRMYKEKKFFNISFLSGVIFYLNTTLPQYRTKNFNNFLP
jgi:anaerobic magnesium-protoporphyrin IX monomethyl ester cyclase